MVKHLCGPLVNSFWEFGPGREARGKSECLEQLSAGAGRLRYIRPIVLLALTAMELLTQNPTLLTDRLMADLAECYE